MWEYLAGELCNKIDALQEDWEKIREGINAIDLSDFTKSARKDLSNSKKEHTTSLRKVMEFTDLLCSEHDYSTTLTIYMLKEALHDLEDAVDSLHGCVVVKGNAEVEEELFDVAACNISAAYEVAEEMNEFRDTDIYGVVYAIPPHAIDTGLNNTSTKRRLMRAALYECVRNAEAWPW